MKGGMDREARETEVQGRRKHDERTSHGAHELPRGSLQRNNLQNKRYKHANVCGNPFFRTGDGEGTQHEIQN